MSVISVTARVRHRGEMGVSVQTQSGRVTYRAPTSGVNVDVLPFIRGPRGEAGPTGVEPDLPDLTLIFENKLI